MNLWTTVPQRQSKDQPKNSREAMLAFSECTDWVFLQCSSMCYLCHAETCIKMKCHTSLPFQSVVQFIFLSSDRVHKFNNYILSCSLYSLSASYSVFSLSLQACRKCLILGFLWSHNRQEKQNKMLSII